MRERCACNFPRMRFSRAQLKRTDENQIIIYHLLFVVIAAYYVIKNESFSLHKGERVWALF